jgi:opacity protein-like surface antigen
MHARSFVLAAVALVLSASAAVAQATSTPSYNAPYRAFTTHEFGGTFSFPQGNRDFAIEGQYRFGHGRFDIGLRGGIVDIEAGGSDIVLGIEGRGRVLDHTTGTFPLDGAIVLGVGTREFDAWTVPSAGLSLGRRVNLEGFSFVAYGQPTLFVFSGSDSTDVEFGLGLGADFKVGNALDLRVSFGLFDGPEGVAVSLVWVR